MTNRWGFTPNCMMLLCSCLCTCSHEITPSWIKTDYLQDYEVWLMNYFCLTWQPKQTASCTGPSVGMSAWQLWAPSEQSEETQERHHKSTPERFPPSPPRGQNRWQRTLVMSEVFMYGSAQWVMPFCNTFSTRATRKISAWGLVTEKIPCKREGEMTEEA